MREVEILAPAGSYGGIAAAINAGADAVYIGGRMFGARAYADNPETENLIRAIEWVHLHGKRLYLTVNTLLKDNELYEQLIPFLSPLYEAGLDAVIVQDFGALEAIAACFPEMAIHASTQMCVTSAEYAAYLKELGVSRIVPARELNLTELKRMKSDTGLEIETFVHGALCYCYSGQCLLSSMIGGRSGNRGRCAQPCRLPYSFDEKGRIAASAYLLSPKDICTLKLIPDLIDAGIDSFKIEGRMKKPEYAAFVSAMYKKYVTLYSQKGREGYHVSEEDMLNLMDLYNRGGFTEGYYKTHNGRRMISMTKPNHFGTEAAKVTAAGKQGVQLKALCELHPKDVLEYGSDAVSPCTVTLKAGAAAGEAFFVRVPAKGLKNGGLFYRTRNEALLERIRKSLIACETKEKLYASLKVLKDLPVTMAVKGCGQSIEVSGECAVQAQNRPVTEADIRRQIAKTGGTPFEFSSITVEMDEDVYISITAINALRRLALAALMQAVQEKYRRPVVKKVFQKPEETGGPSSDELPKLNVYIRSLDYLQLLEPHHEIQCIYVESSALEPLDKDKISQLSARIHRAGSLFYIAMPYIFRDAVKKHMDKAHSSFFDAGADGYLVRNIESWLYLKSKGIKKNIVFDTPIYTFNQSSKAFWKRAGAAATTVPLELNYHELKQRGCRGEEICLYGYIPLMVSAQCLKCTAGGCKKSEGGHTIKLTDRMGKQLTVKAECAYCYNLIYNSQPLYLNSELESIQMLHPASARISFTWEDMALARALLTEFIDGWCYGRPHPDRLKDFTKGHLKRGVE